MVFSEANQTISDIYIHTRLSEVEARTTLVTVK